MSPKTSNGYVACGIVAIPTLPVNLDVPLTSNLYVACSVVPIPTLPPNSVFLYILTLVGKIAYISETVSLYAVEASSY